MATMILSSTKSLSHSYPGLVRTPLLWLDRKDIITLETLATLVIMGFFICFKCRQDRRPIQGVVLWTASRLKSNEVNIVSRQRYIASVLLEGLSKEVQRPDAPLSPPPPPTAWSWPRVRWPAHQIKLSS